MQNDQRPCGWGGYCQAPGKRYRYGRHGEVILCPHHLKVARAAHDKRYMGHDHLPVGEEIKS